MKEARRTQDNLKRYIGDGVYASFDGYHVWLTTENGYRVTNRIALEPPVLAALNRYVEDLARRKESPDAG